MKQLKLLGCVLALGALAFFTGCGGDNQPGAKSTRAMINQKPARMRLRNATFLMIHRD